MTLSGRTFASRGNQRRLNIFVSSTFRDLQFFRAEVRNIISQLGHEPLAMETFGARPEDPEKVCENEIKKCDMFLGLYGFYYGYTPGANRTSITWLEYEFAKSLGKPRFCFLADPALKFHGHLQMTPKEERLPTLEEKDWKQQKLDELKGVIAQELAREIFTSRGDLCAKVAVAINNYIQGKFMGQSADEILTRWAKWERGELDDIYLQKLNQDSTANIPSRWPSPVSFEWNKFSTAPQWHSVMEAKAKAIQSLLWLVPRREADALSHAISEVRWGAKYSSICEDMRKAFDRSTIDAILVHLAVRQAQSDDGKGVDEVTYGNRLKDLFGEIETDLRRPRFRRCFHVAGSMGAGKTHFIASLLAEDTKAIIERKYLVMPLNDPIHGSELERAILAHIQQATQIQWHSFSQFDEFLWQAGQAGNPTGGLRLFLTFDDFSNWLRHDSSFKSTLIKLISSWTKYNSIHWVFTVNDADLDMVLDEAFLMYGGCEALRPEVQESNIRAIGEWLQLDYYNKTDGTGVKILKKGLGIPVDEKIGLDFSESAFRSVCHPLIAWTLLELSKDIPIQSMVNLNFVEFVQLHWKKRCQTLAETGSRPIDLEHSVEFVAEYIMATGETSPVRPHLVEKIRQLAGDRSELKDQFIIKECLATLVNGGFLRTDLAREDIEVEKICLQQHYFWFWRFGKVLLRLGRCFPQASWQGQPDWSALNQTCRRFRSDQERAGIIEFFFLLLDTMCPWAETADPILWKNVLNHPEAGAFVLAPIWFAGAKLSFPARQALFNLAIERSFSATDRRTFFAFMYFLGRMGEEQLRGPGVLSLLRANLASIQRFGFRDYYWFIVKETFRGVKSTETLLDCACCCFGCEILGLQEQLTSLIMQRCNELTNSVEGLLEWMWKFLTADEGSNYLEELDVGGGEFLGWRRHSYREWMLHAFCHLTTSYMGFKAFAFLSANGWFKTRAQRDPRVRIEMEREATIALGHHYQHLKKQTEPVTFRGLQQEYTSLVEDYAASPLPREKEIAFHLIRHTVPTQGRSSVPIVEKHFQAVLARMKNDPVMYALVNKFTVFFERNLKPSDESD